MQLTTGHTLALPAASRGCKISYRVAKGCHARRASVHSVRRDGTFIVVYRGKFASVAPSQIESLTPQAVAS